MTHHTLTQPVAAARRSPPGPRGHLLWGMLPELRRNKLRLFGETVRAYGDVTRLRFLHVTTYSVQSPEGIKHVLQDNNRNYRKGEFVNGVLTLALGENLLTTDGESWLSRRRLMQPAFHRQRIAAFGAMMEQITHDTLDQWRGQPEGEYMDMEHEMMALTLRIAGQTLFSVDLLGESQALGDAFTVLSQFIDYRLETPYPPPLFVPTAQNRRFKQAMRTIDQTVQAMIAERRRKPSEKQDLLAMLMEARDADTGEGMTDQELRHEIGLMIFAGHETTATTLTWALYELARNDEVAQKLADEVDAVLAGRPATVADLPNLPYARMIVDEALRLYPAAWNLSRQAINDDVVCGYQIPAGAQLSLSTFAVHRDPRWWSEPERFDPERFTPERAAGRPPYAYLPFGGGPRLCIGNMIALTEAPLILAAIAQRYRLRLKPDHPVEPHPLVTLRTSHGLPVRLAPRA